MTVLTRSPRRGRTAAALGLSALLAASAVAPPAAAEAAPEQARGGLDRAALRQTLDAMHAAGMYGAYSDVRDGRSEWDGAAGVADAETGRPVHPDMRHRVGSVTKTFTAVAILQQVGRGRIELDAPVARYLPGLVPGERGEQVTVRMLLNHTSGIGDYVPGAFPSLAQGSPQSLDDNRLRRFRPEELVAFGLAAPATGEPGQNWSYSNTNYVIAGLLLEKVTGTGAERYITRHVIRKAGLRDTFFPATPHIPGPHSKAYEALYGLIDPPRDYSVYDMSWAGTAGALVSTVDDLNRFYRLLLGGGLLPPAQLEQMRTAVPVPPEWGMSAYGLGLAAVDLPCGRFWGHSGGVWGMGTYSLSGADGRRQFSIGFNLMKYNQLDENGNLLPHPIDAAFAAHMVRALCDQDLPAAGPAATPDSDQPSASARSARPSESAETRWSRPYFPLRWPSVKR